MKWLDKLLYRHLQRKHEKDRRAFEIENPDDKKFLITFQSYQFGNNIFYGGNDVMGDTSDSGGIYRKKPETKVIEVKPIDVVKELERVPTNYDLQGLDDKIKIFKYKKEFINTNQYAKRDIDAMIERFENRKKYNKFREYFTRFDVTTSEKIDVLISKYKNLQMGNPELFIPDLPAEAITTMKEYTDKVMEVCGKKPKFYIIATKESFQQKVQKRDPILLADNPFAFVYTILGAWDKEMEYLPEL